MIFNINSTRGHTGSLLVYTRVASHVARSDTPGITCVVARLFRSDPPPTLLWRPFDQWQGSTCVARWPKFQL